jgi:hypothetical protein
MKRKLIDMLAGTVGRLLTMGRPDEVPLEKVRDLQQTDEVWESTVRLARVWITPDDEAPYRPYLALTVSPKGQLLGAEILDKDPPTPAEVTNALAKAMRHPSPGAGGKRRPKTIQMDDESLVEALAPKLEEVGVRCEYRRTLREAEYALSEMDRFMSEEEPIPGLLDVPGVTPFMVGGVFEAADYFYRETPWRWLDDSHPIEMRYPVDSKPRYAVVMGHGGETYGLALYNSTEILQATYAGVPPDQLIGQEGWTAVLFGEAIEMSFDDLDAIRKYDWPVTGEYAYPLVIQITRSGQPTRPSKSELLRIEAALLAIPDFVKHQMAANKGRPRSAAETLTVAMADGEDQIALRYPVPGLEANLEDFLRTSMMPEDEEKVKAARKRNDELLKLFKRRLTEQGLSKRTVKKHLKKLELFADDYMAIDGGSIASSRPADRATMMDVDEFLAEWLLYEEPLSPVAETKAHITAIKKFYAYLKEMRQMPVEDADEILELLQRDRDYYLELAQEFEEER